MKKEELEKEIEKLQRKLDKLNNYPEDTFILGTVIVFDGRDIQKKWYYVKTAEETWQIMKGGTTKSLSEWLLHNEESGIGYFEVYELRVHPNPIFATEE